MDKAKTIQIAREYARCTLSVLDANKVILYGSSARGDGRDDSDINIAVVVYKLEEDFLDAEIKLFRLRRDVDDRIKPILIKQSSDKSGFLDEIERTGILIFSQ